MGTGRSTWVLPIAIPTPPRRWRSLNPTRARPGVGSRHPIGRARGATRGDGPTRMQRRCQIHLDSQPIDDLRTVHSQPSPPSPPPRAAVRRMWRTNVAAEADPTKPTATCRRMCSHASSSELAEEAEWCRAHVAVCAADDAPDAIRSANTPGGSGGRRLTARWRVESREPLTPMEHALDTGRRVKQCVRVVLA